MSKTYILISAILFTLATLFWGFTLFSTVNATGGWPLMNTIVVMTFAALTGIYWVMYFRRQKDMSVKKGGEA